MLENSMNDADHSTAHNILENLNSVYGEDDKQTADINPVVDEDLDARDLEEVAEAVGPVSQAVVIDDRTHIDPIQ